MPRMRRFKVRSLGLQGSRSSLPVLTGPTWQLGRGGEAEKVPADRGGGEGVEGVEEVEDARRGNTTSSTLMVWRMRPSGVTRLRRLHHAAPRFSLPHITAGPVAAPRTTRADMHSCRDSYRDCTYPERALGEAQA